MDYFKKTSERTAGSNDVKIREEVADPPAGMSMEQRLDWFNGVMLSPQMMKAAASGMYASLKKGDSKVLEAYFTRFLGIREKAGDNKGGVAEDLFRALSKDQLIQLAASRASAGVTPEKKRAVEEVVDMMVTTTKA